jgi:PadR family transcriptional regulator, regulatory protein PadR
LRGSKSGYAPVEICCSLFGLSHRLKEPPPPKLTYLNQPPRCNLAGFGLKHVDCLHPMTQNKTGYQNRIELLQGTLDMLILKTLQWGEQHGYGISQAIRASSCEVLQVETGSLYPALHRLERQGWVSSEWKKSESNQRAKFYRITALGKKQLASDYERWGRMVATIEGIMSARSKA